MKDDDRDNCCEDDCKDCCEDNDGGCIVNVNVEGDGNDDCCDNDGCDSGKLNSGCIFATRDDDEDAEICCEFEC